MNGTSSGLLIVVSILSLSACTADINAKKLTQLRSAMSDPQQAFVLHQSAATQIAAQYFIPVVLPGSSGGSSGGMMAVSGLSARSEIKQGTVGVPEGQHVSVACVPDQAIIAAAEANPANVDIGAKGSALAIVRNAAGSVRAEVTEAGDLLVVPNDGSQADAVTAAWDGKGYNGPAIRCLPDCTNRGCAGGNNNVANNNGPNNGDGSTSSTSSSTNGSSNSGGTPTPDATAVCTIDADVSPSPTPSTSPSPTPSGTPTDGGGGGDPAPVRGAIQGLKSGTRLGAPTGPGKTCTCKDAGGWDANTNFPKGTCATFHNGPCDPNIYSIECIPFTAICFCFDMGTLAYDPCKKDCYLKNKYPHKDGGCLRAGTLVKLASGEERAIENIHPGDRLFNPVRHTAVRVSDISQDTDYRPMIEVVVGDRQVVMTVDHPVPTARGLISASQIKAGDSLRDERNRPVRVTRVKRVGGAPSAPTVIHNVILDAPDSDREGHYFVAGGLVTGDLVLQKQLAGEAKKNP